MDIIKLDNSQLMRFEQAINNITRELRKLNELIEAVGEAGKKFDEVMSTEVSNGPS